MPLKEIAQADDWQIVNLYLRPGEEDEAKNGAYWPVSNIDRRNRAPQEWAPGIKGGNFEAMYKAVWQGRGCDAGEVEERWAMYLQENPGLNNV